MGAAMKDANGKLLGATSFSYMAMDGGGWVTGIDIADDGTMVCRNDTFGAHVRSNSDREWRSLFLIGETFSESAFVFKNPAHWCYEVCVAPANSNVIYASAMGYLWKSSNGGTSMTRLNGYKRGNVDIEMSFGAADYARLGGQHMRVDPANANVVAFGHPVDGLYYTVDGGEKWVRHPDIPKPSSTIGITLVFDRTSTAIDGQTQTVCAVVAGQGTYRSTTGVSGRFVRMADGPSVASSMAASGGKLFIAGDGLNADSQLYVWTGSSWSLPAGVVGFGVALRPNVPQAIFVMTIGGVTNYASIDGGQTWKEPKLKWSIVSDDVPWLAWTKCDFFALGAMVFHPVLDRLIATNGIGVFTMDNPPLTGQESKRKWQSITKGIQQIIPMEVAAAPDGRVHVAVMDRAIFNFDRDSCGTQISRHGPDNSVTLRQGTSVDFAADDPGYVVTTFMGSGSISLSKDGGRSWQPLLSVPTFMQPKEGVVPFYAGSIAVGNAGNMVWVSNANGGVRTTRDGGDSWLKPSFQGTDMTGAYWHNAWFLRRRVVVADKANPGTFYVFCVGTGNDDSQDRAQIGLWKSTDGGINFIRIRNTLFSRYVTDFWHGKLKLVPGQANHLVWCVGPQNNYPTPPSDIGIFYSTDGGVNTRMLAGWKEPDDIAFGKAASGAYFPAIYVVGWRDGVHGLWRCIDFNPADLSGTWQNLARWPLGRYDENITLAADMTRFGRVYYAFSGGGVAYADYDYRLQLS
jgi:photosystem II stability/assembly factor-like uncharacterized protein